MKSLAPQHGFWPGWKNLFHQSTGPLTSELLRAPGGFGLGQVSARKIPDATTAMSCGFCSTGCSLTIHLKQGEAIGLSPTMEHPVNLGMACPKGWEALTVLNADDRATTPLARDADGRLRSMNWQQALALFCERFRAIQQRHGTESVAFLSTGQIATEEMALLGSLAKFGMGMLHGDGNTRQCMASAVVAYKQSFGFDSPPYTYDDLEQSDVIVLVGSNLCLAHPILWQRIQRNPHRPEIIVIDPRTTETAMGATLHLPLAPKSDLTLFQGLAHILFREDWVAHDFVAAHTTGCDEFRQHVQEFTPQRVASITHLDERTLLRVARRIHQGRNVSFWWTMGVNQSYEGVRTAQSLINLALLTGNIGRPGTGANSITGQCNAMGSRLFSNTTNLLGGRDFQNVEHRASVARILEISPNCIPNRPSLAYDQIIEGVLHGRIKGLWVVGTNPAHSWINQNVVRDVLSRLEFLVVQDMYTSTETARQAHLLLPAAGWGEKDGTLINSERRIGLIKKVARAPGQALADFSIFRLIAEAWGCDSMFRDWTSPEAVFHKLRDLSRGQPCDFSGIADYQMLDRCGGIQWPYPEQSPDPAPQRRLFADGVFFHADGKARFIFDHPAPLLEEPSDRYPLLLLTGRGSAAQWHTQTRTSKSPLLRQLYPERIYVEINPADARRHGIRPEQHVVVESQRGSLVARAFVTTTVRPGQIFLPMHYEETNRLTLAHFDPHSRQPSYKNCAVRIRAADTSDG